LLRICILAGVYEYWGTRRVWKWILLKKDFCKWWRWKGFSILKPYFIHIYIKNNLYIVHIQTNYPPLKEAYKKGELPVVVYRFICSEKHPSLPRLSYLLQHEHQRVPIYLNLGQELFYTMGNLKKTQSHYLLKLNLLRIYKIRKKRIAFYEIPIYRRKIGHALYDYLLKDLHQEQHHITDLISNYPISRSGLFKVFKLVIGVSPNTVKRDRRLINFKNRLLQTDHSIYNLYLESGFKSQSHLQKLFHKTYEMPPQEFRNKYRR